MEIVQRDYIIIGEDKKRIALCDLRLVQQNTIL